MRHVFFIFLTVLLLCAQPHHLRAQDAPALPVEQPEDLRDILRHAYQDNPTLMAARAGMKATQEIVPQALAGWKPTIDANGNVTHADIEGSNFGGSGTTSREVELAFTQPLYRGGRTVSATDSADSTVTAQLALLNALEQQVLLKVATAFMDVVRDQALLDLARNNETLLAKEFEATRQRFELGELTRTDVSQAEARLAGARAAKEKATGTLQASRAVYEQVTGLPPSMLGTPDISFPVPETPEESAVFAEQNNPNVIAASHMHEAAVKDIGGVFGELLPELSLFGSWDRQYDPQPGLIDESTSKTVGISATIPLYEAGATRSRIRQAKHTANQRRIEIAEMRRQVRQQAIANHEALRAARANIEARKVQVDASETAWRGVKEESTLGSRTVLDVLNADQELLDSRAALVTARRDEVVSLFALAETLGVLTPQTLGFSDFSQDFEANLETIRWKILGTDVDFEGDTP